MVLPPRGILASIGKTQAAMLCQAGLQAQAQRPGMTGQCLSFRREHCLPCAVVKALLAVGAHVADGVMPCQFTLQLGGAVGRFQGMQKSEERRGGKECVSTSRSSRAPSP